MDYPAGVCQCESDFSGDDCSVDLTQPPDIIAVPLEGVCDLSTRPCRETPLYGRNFLDSPNIKCKVKITLVRQFSFKTLFTTHPDKM